MSVSSDVLPSRRIALNPSGLFWFVLLVVAGLPVYWLGFARSARPGSRRNTATGR